MWAVNECPVSYCHGIWDIIDWFSMCYNVGGDGTVTRQGYPHPGAVGEQDARLMYGMQICADEITMMSREARDQAMNRPPTHDEILRKHAG